MTDIVFTPFPKLARLVRDCVITEKIDGTNASVIITDDGRIAAASRTRIITPGDDNFGFARWVEGNRDDLLNLGPGQHFGEWWGAGIQRGYGLREKRFSLFNTARWSDNSTRPACCGVVPVLHIGRFDSQSIDEAVRQLELFGSVAAPGFTKPEGVVIYHTAANMSFKRTIEKDEEPKGARKAA